MSRLIKDYLEVGDHLALDDLIAQLEAIRAGLPEGTDAHVKIRGDDVFGRHLCVAFMRGQSEAEADCERRYGGATAIRRAA